MSDAQAEAERIVRRVAGERVDPSVAEAFTGKGGAVRHVNRERDRLVAALAAAIEVRDSALTPMGGWVEVNSGHVRALDTALSALRQTDGEDT